MKYSFVISYVDTVNDKPCGHPALLTWDPRYLLGSWTGEPISHCGRLEELKNLRISVPFIVSRRLLLFTSRFEGTLKVTLIVWCLCDLRKFWSVCHLRRF